MTDSVFYKNGTFTDWLGKEHKFVVCAVVDKPENETVLATVGQTPEGHRVAVPVLEYDGDGHIVKSVFIGVSICNPIDEFNEEIGKKIAYNKAITSKKAQHWVASNIPGLLGNKVVEALLEQEVEYVAEHPDSIIAGYSKSKEKYEAARLAQKQYAALPGHERVVVDAINDGIDIVKLAGIAMNLGKAKELTAPKAHPAHTVAETMVAEDFD